MLDFVFYVLPNIYTRRKEIAKLKKKKKKTIGEIEREAVGKDKLR